MANHSRRSGQNVSSPSSAGNHPELEHAFSTGGEKGGVAVSAESNHVRTHASPRRMFERCAMLA